MMKYLLFVSLVFSSIGFAADKPSHDAGPNPKDPMQRELVEILARMPYVPGISEELQVLTQRRIRRQGRRAARLSPIRLPRRRPQLAHESQAPGFNLELELESREGHHAAPRICGLDRGQGRRAESQARGCGGEVSVRGGGTGGATGRG